MVIYSANSSIKPLSSENYTRTTITGTNSTFDSMYNRSTLIMGNNSTYTATGLGDEQRPFCGGVVVLGGDSKLTAPERNKPASGNTNTMSFDGVIVAGSRTDVWTKTAFSEDISNETPFGGKGIMIDGCALFGKQSTVALRDVQNTGLIMLGEASVVKAKNNSGVIISSRPINYSLQKYDENGVRDFDTKETDGTEGRRKNEVSGLGIYITGSEMDATNYTNGAYTIKNSMIQGSSNTLHPTILKGSFKLDDEFTLYARDGKTIIFQNGKLTQS